MLKIGQYCTGLWKKNKTKKTQQHSIHGIIFKQYLFASAQPEFNIHTL